MCPSAPRVCSEPGGQKPVLSLSLDRILSAKIKKHENSFSELAKSDETHPWSSQVNYWMPFASILEKNYCYNNVRLYPTSLQAVTYIGVYPRKQEQQSPGQL